MPVVTVAGAVAMGALTPRGEAPTIEFNSTGSKGWVIHLSGGGWGFMKNTSATVAFKRDGARTPAGATAGGEHAHASAAPRGQRTTGCYVNCDGIMSDDAAQNPLFHTYNKVFVPINDGTSFTGDLDKPIPASDPPKFVCFLPTSTLTFCRRCCRV